MKVSSGAKGRFISDAKFQLCAYKDMYYNLLDNRSLEMDKIDKEVISCVYSEVVNYFKNKVRVAVGSELFSPEILDFHYKFGWVVTVNDRNAYLGKVAFNGSCEIEVGLNSYISGNSYFNGSGKIKIGAFCSIANGVEFFSSNINHITEYLSTFNFHSNERILHDESNLVLPNYSQKLEKLKSNNFIEIGNDVWIGRCVTIFPGNKIENGAIIGINSFVNNNINAFGIYVGSPSKLIKYRFSIEKINHINNMKWWEWSLEKIKNNTLLFDNDFTAISSDIISNITIK